MKKILIIVPWVFSGVLALCLIATILAPTQNVLKATTSTITTTAKSTTLTTNKPTTVTTISPTPQQASYVLNTNTKKIHHPRCRYVKEIHTTNRQNYHGDCSSLTAQGYSFCKVCF